MKNTNTNSAVIQCLFRGSKEDIRNIFRSEGKKSITKGISDRRKEPPDFRAKPDKSRKGINVQFSEKQTTRIKEKGKPPQKPKAHNPFKDPESPVQPAKKGRISVSVKPTPNKPLSPFGKEGKRIKDSSKIMAVQLMPEKLDLQSRGIQMAPGIRKKLEKILNFDFSNVRIHESLQPAALGALAFTSGKDIYITPGEFNYKTEKGLSILGTQLAYVMQQQTGRAVNPFGSGIALVQDPVLNEEAQRIGQTVAGDILKKSSCERNPVSEKQGS